jgi:hypothetical protein
MSHVQSLSNNRNLEAYDGAGTKLSPSDITGHVTLTATDDFYVPVPNADDALIESIQIIPSALIAGVFTIETSNLPDVGPTGVTYYNETAGNWIKEDPTTAYVATIGSGWTVSNLTLTKTAAASGGAMIHLGNLAAKRVRIKAAITTTGTIRVVAHGKA